MSSRVLCTENKQQHLYKANRHYLERQGESRGLLKLSKQRLQCLELSASLKLLADVTPNL